MGKKRSEEAWNIDYADIFAQFGAPDRFFKLRAEMRVCGNREPAGDDTCPSTGSKCTKLAECRTAQNILDYKRQLHGNASSGEF